LLRRQDALLGGKTIQGKSGVLVELFPLFPEGRILWRRNLWNQSATGWGKLFCDAEMRRASSFLGKRFQFSQGKEVLSGGSG
jgi:hypothetical protein